MKKTLLLSLLIAVAILLALSACQKNSDISIEFENLCKERKPGNWMDMKPMRNGEFTSDGSCWGCMSDDGMSHFCSMEQYKGYLESQE